MSAQDNDYFRILGVGRNATQADIDRAFRQQARKHHPDKTGSQSATYDKINSAAQVLKSPSQRRKYREELEARERREAASRDARQAEAAEAASEDRKNQELRDLQEKLEAGKRKAKAQKARAKQEKKDAEEREAAAFAAHASSAWPPVQPQHPSFTPQAHNNFGRQRSGWQAEENYGGSFGSPNTHYSSHGSTGFRGTAPATQYPGARRPEETAAWHSSPNWDQNPYPQSHFRAGVRSSGGSWDLQGTPPKARPSWTRENRFEQPAHLADELGKSLEKLAVEAEGPVDNEERLCLERLRGVVETLRMELITLHRRAAHPQQPPRFSPSPHPPC